VTRERRFPDRDDGRGRLRAARHPLRRANVWLADAAQGVIDKLDAAGAILQTVTVGAFRSRRPSTARTSVPNSSGNSVTVAGVERSRPRHADRERVVQPLPRSTASGSRHRFPRGHRLLQGGRSEPARVVPRPDRTLTSLVRRRRLRFTITSPDQLARF
jgi:hypothetical protein